MAYWLLCQSCKQWSKSATALSDDKSCPFCDTLFVPIKAQNYYAIDNVAEENQEAQMKTRVPECPEMPKTLELEFAPQTLVDTIVHAAEEELEISEPAELDGAPDLIVHLDEMPPESRGEVSESFRILETQEEADTDWEGEAENSESSTEVFIEEIYKEDAQRQEAAIPQAAETGLTGSAGKELPIKDIQQLAEEIFEPVESEALADDEAEQDNRIQEVLEAVELPIIDSKESDAFCEENAGSAGNQTPAEDGETEKEPNEAQELDGQAKPESEDGISESKVLDVAENEKMRITFTYDSPPLIKNWDRTEDAGGGQRGRPEGEKQAGEEVGAYARATERLELVLIEAEAAAPVVSEEETARLVSEAQKINAEPGVALLDTCEEPSAYQADTEAKSTQDAVDGEEAGAYDPVLMEREETPGDQKDVEADTIPEALEAERAELDAPAESGCEEALDLAADDEDVEIHEELNGEDEEENLEEGIGCNEDAASADEGGEAIEDSAEDASETEGEEIKETPRMTRTRETYIEMLRRSRNIR